MYKIAFAGYATVDVIANQLYLGGAAGIMALNAALLGVQASLIAILSRDTYGKWYESTLRRSGVDITHCVFAPHLPTCIIQNPHGKGSSRIWRDNGTHRYIKNITLMIETLSTFDGIFVVNSHPDLGEKIAEKSNDNLFYIHGHQVVHKRHYVRDKILSKSTIIFGNQEESPFIFEKKPFNFGVKMVVITKGEKGGIVFFKNRKTTSFQAPKIAAIVDSTGAGDAFALGFGLSFIAGRTVTGAIKEGKKLSRKVIGHKGGLISSNF